MCENKDCQHKKESPIKDWKHRCKYGPDGRRLQNGTVIVGWNDMATVHPRLAKECLDNPKLYQARTAEVLNWRCSTCGYKWGGTGIQRVTSHGVIRKCLCCSNKVVVPGINDMATTHPEMAKLLDGDATKVFAWTHQVLSWKCPICSYKWRGKGNSRMQRKSSRKGFRGCACCANKVVVPGINDMATTHPEMAKTCLDDPTKFTAGTNKLLRWKCLQCGYKWKASGPQKAKTKCGCCSNKVVVSGINDMATTHPEMAKECLSNAKKVTAGTRKMLRWKCPLCKGKYWATGGNRLSGSGCSDCAPYGFKTGRDSFLYLVSRPGQLKIGIANIGSSRLDQHMRKKWNVFDVLNMSGRLARLIESHIKKALARRLVLTGLSVFGSKFDGCTEAWLKKDLYARSIRGLCRKLGINLDAFLAA